MNALFYRYGVFIMQDNTSSWAAVPLRAWFAALAFGLAGTVVLGLSLQHLFRLSPCPLCIFQRLLYMVAAVLATGGFVWPRLRLLWLGGVGAIAALGVGVAAYQSWMQAFPSLASECSYSDPNLIERLVDWLGMQYPSLFMATGFCTSREWELFGLSMANWSFLLFSGVLVYVYGLGRIRQA